VSTADPPANPAANTNGRSGRQQLDAAITPPSAATLASAVRPLREPTACSEFFRTLLQNTLLRMLESIVTMTADIERVTRLQDLDLKIAELQREVSELPKHIAHIEKTLESHLRHLEAGRAALAANQKERKSLEDDIKVQQQKVSKLRDQMLQAKTNEQYRAFQHEIDYCDNAVRKAEDRILDLMTESEPLDVNVKKAEGALKQEKDQVEAEKTRARERTAIDQKQFAELEAERRGVVADIPPPTLKAYERIRKKRPGKAIAEATDGRCSVCQISLRPQFLQDLRKGEQLMFCESCGRILYYDPPVSFEADLAAQPR
jgi:uncharacterized protein